MLKYNFNPHSKNFYGCCLVYEKHKLVGNFQDPKHDRRVWGHYHSQHHVLVGMYVQNLPAWNYLEASRYQNGDEPTGTVALERDVLGEMLMK